MIFKDESYVRDWLRKNSKGALFWVEAASGGTHGFPDAVQIEDGHTTYIEAKVGELRGEEVVFEMANVQRIVGRKMAQAGGDVWCLVGEKNGSRVWMADIGQVVPRPGEAEVDQVKTRILHAIPASCEYRPGEAI